VLKPIDDYGGHGVYVGARVHDAAWENALTTAAAGDYVVEEAIEPRAEEFPVFNDTEWAVSADVCGHEFISIFRKVCGAMVRLSNSPIVNVPSGSGETGFFVIEDKARTKSRKTKPPDHSGSPELTHSLNISFPRAPVAQLDRASD
jgi:hypothetical protein